MLITNGGWLALAVALSACLCFAAREAMAYGLYQDRLPNGHNVKDPRNPKYDCPALGHITCTGGDYNDFGWDFDDAGRRWTVELCQKDSDGDGATNGQELGDPDCVWRPGQVPRFTDHITHPGMKGDFPPANIMGEYALLGKPKIIPEDVAAVPS